MYTEMINKGGNIVKTYQFSDLENKITSLCEGSFDRACHLEDVQMTISHNYEGREFDYVRLSDMWGTLNRTSSPDYGVSHTAMKSVCHRINFPYKFWAHLDFVGECVSRNQLANNLLTNSDDDVLLRFNSERNIYGVNSLHYERINHDFVWSLLANNEVMSDFNIVDMNVTHDYLSVKVISKNVQEVDDVGVGFIITNSMSGLRALEIKCFVFVLACSNGMIVSQGSLGDIVRRVHKGSKLSIGAQEPPNYRDPKFWQISDLVGNQIMYARSRNFKGIVIDKISKAMETPILEEKDTDKVKNILNLTEKEKAHYNKSLHNNLPQHGRTLWGYVQAATEMAHLPPFEGTPRQEEIEQDAWRALEKLSVS